MMTSVMTVALATRRLMEARMRLASLAETALIVRVCWSACARLFKLTRSHRAVPAGMKIAQSYFEPEWDNAVRPLSFEPAMLTTLRSEYYIWAIREHETSTSLDA